MPFVLALGFAVTSFGAPVYGAAAVGTKAETATEAVSAGLSTTLQSGPRPQREVDVIVVWGFRLRSAVQPTQSAALRSGYLELVDKVACIDAVCGFVVAPDGNRWRASNVLSGTEAELQERQRNMERDGATLVIVHPNGARRSIPTF